MDIGLKIAEVAKGDLVEFKEHGLLYVTNNNFGGVSFWVTDQENERYNIDNPNGWYVSKQQFIRIIQRGCL
jgi:NMD protein affecting ribosome stability and mRNA decay